MSLDNFFDTNESVELIKRRRLQLIVHSAIYYEFNDNIISDHQYDDWTEELVKLHKKNPSYSDRFDQYFKDWNGETGFHFPRDEEILTRAGRILKQHSLIRQREINYEK